MYSTTFCLFQERNDLAATCRLNCTVSIRESNKQSSWVNSRPFSLATNIISSLATISPKSWATNKQSSRATSPQC